MIEIPKVSERIRKTLETAGWTMETLAEADVDDLTRIEGIGNTTAWRIIVYARRQTRTQREKQPVIPDEHWLTPDVPPPGIYSAPPVKPDPPGLMEMSVEEMEAKFAELAPDEPVPEMAVRVKRNWLRKRLRELMV